MCLERIIKRYKRPATYTTYARLIFLVTHETLKIVTPYQKYEIVVGGTHRSQDGLIYMFNGLDYPAGFHRWKKHQYVPFNLDTSVHMSFRLLVSGELSGIHTLGLDNGLETYVGTGWRVTKKDLDLAAQEHCNYYFDEMIRKFRRMFC